MRAERLVARSILAAALTAGLLAAAPAFAQEHPVQSTVWPADLVPPPGEAWIGPRSVGPAKDYFRQWTARVNSAPAQVDVPQRFAWPGASTIVETSVAADGRVQSVALLRSSGIPQFDEFVLQGVREADPFPAPPADVLGGRAAVKVVALFGAAYFGKTADGTMLRGVPHAANDVLQRTPDAKAWSSFYARFLPALQDDLLKHVPRPHAPASVAVFLETADGRIQATDIKGSAAPEFKSALLARARSFAARYETPGDRDVMPVVLPIHFDASPAPASASAANRH